MEQILQAYGLPKEYFSTIMMLYKNMKAMVCAPDGDTDFFRIAPGYLQIDILAPSIFIKKCKVGDRSQ